ncbi:MAG: 2-hydroxychromene-2-carboxylate isomerase [Gammaproteobacteria bacterium]|nr:2-hydroxychromene-2-carboxylate isomerase [Gammaproteobacteria bacterium]
MSAHKPAPAVVEFYFDCACPWSYLALGRLQEAAIRTGAQIIYRPVLLAEISASHTAQAPVAHDELAAARQRYRGKDLQDWARFCGVILRDPGPTDSSWAQRGAIVAQRAGCVPAYLGAIYRGRFAGQQDISQLAEVTALAGAAGMDAEAFDAAVRAPDTLVAVRENAARLLHHGGFGTPTMLVGTDLYFGNDRMPLVEIALARAGGMRLVMPGEHGS